MLEEERMNDNNEIMATSVQSDQDALMSLDFDNVRPTP